MLIEVQFWIKLRIFLPLENNNKSWAVLHIKYNDLLVNKEQLLSVKYSSQTCDRDFLVWRKKTFWISQKMLYFICNASGSKP